ncbi:MAG TPA: class E sortase [Egibacteraceae bacterium]|nr:class E sortase [Egibacteraceae bacterium]
MTRALRYTGWSLIVAGFVVLLYVVYTLFFTNLATNAAQNELADDWARRVAQAVEAPEEEEPEAEPPLVDPGTAVAVLQFSRPGTDQRPVHADPLYVVSGVSQAHLTRGPGHYPDSAAPGGDGNFAVAGHRTTYGAPFYHLDQLVDGDHIHVTGRDGERHTYQVARQQIVQPGATWVIGADPLDTGAPTLTLTTCHPRFSAAERLVVFAELVS